MVPKLWIVPSHHCWLVFRPPYWEFFFFYFILFYFFKIICVGLLGLLCHFSICESDSKQLAILLHTILDFNTTCWKKTPWGGSNWILNYLESLQSVISPTHPHPLSENHHHSHHSIIIAMTFPQKPKYGQIPN